MDNLPKTYEAEGWYEHFLHEVSAGRFFEDICDEMVADAVEVLIWIYRDEGRLEKFKEAQGIWVEGLMMQVIKISDNAGGEIGRDKLRIDTRFKLAAKLLPDKWGDRTIVAGDADRPLLIEGDRQSLLLETARGIAYLLDSAGKEFNVVNVEDAAEAQIALDDKSVAAPEGDGKDE